MCLKSFLQIAALGKSGPIKRRGQWGEINDETCPRVDSNPQPSDQKSNTLPVDYCTRREGSEESIYHMIYEHMLHVHVLMILYIYYTYICIRLVTMCVFVSIFMDYNINNTLYCIIEYTNRYIPEGGGGAIIYIYKRYYMHTGTLQYMFCMHGFILRISSKLWSSY